MNCIIKPGLALGFLLLLASCGNDTTGSATSTAADSTNLNGTAPVQMHAGDTGSPVNPAEDKPIHALNAGDTVQNANSYQQPTGQGTNASNTSDRRTTSGSANNGDADKDRKK